MKRWVWIIMPLFVFGQALVSQMVPKTKFSPYVDESGEITRPAGYRSEWSHLGTYFVSGESEQDHRMHQVYARPSDIEEFNKDGQWPDGAVIVKEVLHTAEGQLTTGAASWASEPDVWFVMVKDRKGRFPDNPLWGDGWGWALFKSADPSAQAASSYKTDCLTCHIPAKATDYVYLQGYPKLRGSHTPVNTAGEGRVMSAAATVDFSSGSVERGAEVFGRVCSFCHKVDSDERKVGPGLAVIAREGRLPSGKEASTENLLKQINTGGNGMPSFVRALPAQQKADVIAYVLRGK